MGFHFNVLMENLPEFLEGTWVTIWIAAIAIVLAILWGSIIGAVTFRNPKIIGPVCKGYVVFFRETPLLIQLYFIFYGLAQLNVHLPAAVCGVIGLVLNDGAFIAEIIRGGLQSIDKGQSEAAKSLGFSKLQTMRYFLFPQAWKKVADSVVGMVSIIIKDTSLLMWITITELTYKAQMVNVQSFEPVTAFTTAAVIYFVLFLFVQGIRKLLEKRSEQKYEYTRS